MGIVHKALIALLLIYPLTELGRISLTNGIVFNIRDGFVFVVLLALLGVFIKKRTFPSFDLVKPFIIFVSICILSLLVNIHIYGLSTVPSSALYIIRWSCYAGLFFATLYLSRQQKKILAYVLLFDGVVLVLAGFVQYAFYQNLVNLYYLGWDIHMFRLFSTFLDPNFAGIFFALFSVYVLSFAVQERKRRIRFFYTLVLIYSFTMLALLLTFSRSGMLVYVLATSVYFLHLRSKKLLILLLTFFVCGVILFANTGVTSKDPFRMGSSRARLDSVYAAVTIIKDNPFIGVGFNNYRYALHHYGYRNWPASLWETSHADASTDNSLLFVTATTGIVGLVAYLSLWYFVIKRVVSFGDSYRNERSLLLATFSGLLISSLFINALFYPPFMLWMWILLGLMDYKRP